MGKPSARRGSPHVQGLRARELLRREELQGRDQGNPGKKMLGGALLVVLAAFTAQVEASETWNSHFGTDIKGYFTQTGTVTNFAQSAAAVKTFIQLRKDMQNVMTNTQD